MYSDQDVIEAFANWWIRIGGTSEAFAELKEQIQYQIIEQECAGFGDSLGPTFPPLQAKSTHFSTPPPYSQN